MATTPTRHWRWLALGGAILLSGCGAAQTGSPAAVPADQRIPRETTPPPPPPPPPTTAAPAPECDPNYGGCVPIAGDVDCAGGSGNGPAYVQGPVPVTGSDVYGLDADHDGVGCES